jgi:Fe-S cluster biosynthesis and repair protein YggX
MPRLTATRWRQLQLGLLALLIIVVLLLCIDIYAVWAGLFPTRTGERIAQQADIAAWSQLDHRTISLLEKEFDAAVAEIRMRLEQEQALFGMKFVLIGATLGLLIQRLTRREGKARFERSALTALFVWSAVVVATIVDCRVLANKGLIMSLAQWIQRYEQLALGRSARLGWEAFLSEPHHPGASFPALRISIQILSVLLFAVAGALFLIPRHRNNSPDTARVAGAGAITSIILMTVGVASLRSSYRLILFYTALGGFGAAISGILAFISTRNHQLYKDRGLAEPDDSLTSHIGD